MLYNFWRKKRIICRKLGLQEDFHAIYLKNEGQTDGANLTRGKDFELLRSLVEVIAERDRVVQFEDSAGLGPAFQIDRFWSLKNATGG